MASRKHFTATEDEFLDLVSQVYDAGLDASLWNQTLKSMTNFFHAEQGNLRIIDPNSSKINQYYNYNRDPYWIQAYKDYYYQIDPWLEMLHNSDKPIVSCSNHIFSDREYRLTEPYNDYIIPTDTHFAMGGLVKVNQDFKTYLGLQKSYNSGEFHNEQLRLLKKLIPHINKSIHINQRIYQLEFQRNTLQQALNRINSAVFIVNESCRVQFMNTSAESLLDLQPSMSICRHHLQLATARDNKQLAELINNATLGRADSRIVEAGGMQYTQTGNDKGLSILVSPLSRHDIDFNLTGTRAAMIMISGINETTRPTQDMLVAIYRLTESEAKVASLLCAGLTLNKISEQLHLTLNTVKTHLKAIFQKTGTRRQAELMNLINTGPVGILYQAPQE